MIEPISWLVLQEQSGSPEMLFFDTRSIDY